MSRSRVPWRRRLALGLVVCAGTLGITGGIAGCDPSGDEPGTTQRQVPDATLRVHSIEPGQPSPEGLAYLRTVADAHGQADARSGEGRIQVLQQALSRPIPAGLPEAEILRLDLAARLGEEMMSSRHGARAARELLVPMLEVKRSLPLDRATARALVVLGDAAAKTGDDALAAGSYARSIEMMSLLRQELEP